MKQTILILSWVAKLAGFVTGVFTVAPGASKNIVLLFFAASLIKDTANRVDDFLIKQYLPSGKSGFTRPGLLLLATSVCAIALSGLGLVGCGGGGNIKPVIPPAVISTNTVVTPAAPTGPTAMKTWVDNNWLIFYDAGFYGGKAFNTWGVQHSTTAAQLDNYYSLADQGFDLAIKGGDVSSSAIIADIGKAGGNAGSNAQAAATAGSILSPFISPVIALLGGDVQATVEALGLVAKGLSDQGQDALGHPVATPTSNPYAVPIAPETPSTNSATASF